MILSRHRQFTNLYYLGVYCSRCRQRNCKQRTLDKLETKDIILNSSHPYTIEVLYCTTLGVLLDALGLLTLNHKSYVSFARSNFKSSRKCFHNVIHRGVSCIYHLYLTVPFQYDSLRAHTSLTVTKNNFKVQNIQIVRYSTSQEILTKYPLDKALFLHILNSVDYRVR